MRKVNLVKRAFVTVLATSMVFSSGYASVPFFGTSIISEVQAADIRTSIPNSTLYNVLKVLVNSDKDIYADLKSKGKNPDEVDITQEYSSYLSGDELTNGKLSSYEGEINLKPYKGKIDASGLKGLNLARSASKVILPDTITSIPDSAFEGMTGLKYVTMSSNVSSIGLNAFNGCNSLIGVNSTSIVNISNATKIESFAFLGCSSITGISLSSNIQKLGSNAFQNCTSLTGEVFIPNSATSLGTSVFDNTRLTKITFDTNITDIPNYFCANIWTGAGLTVQLNGSKIARIGSSAFMDSKIYYMNIENTAASLKKIDTKAFAGAYLGTVNISELNNLTTIAFGAFSGTSFTIKNVVLPNSVTDIGAAAFASSNITGITIPKQVTVLNNGAFCKCLDLNSVSFGGSGSNSLKKIGKYTFAFCPGLPDTKFIPNSVTTIDDYAFAFCIKPCADASEAISIEGLGEVSLPSSVTTLGKFCFYDCAGLTKISSLGGVTSIPEGAFAIEDVGAMPDWAKNITFEALETANTTVSVTHTKGFVDSYTIESGGTYASCSQDFTASNISSIKSIGNNAFENRKHIKGFNGSNGAINLSSLSSLTDIGDYAFRGCSYYDGGPSTDSIEGMTSLSLPASLKNIGQYAFYQNYSLSKVTFAANSALTKIGNYAFAECKPSAILDKTCGLTTLENFGSQNNLTTIGDYAFNNNMYLKLDTAGTFTFPSKVETIGDYAFADCKYTKSIKFNGSLKKIGSYAFAIIGWADEDYDKNYGLSTANFLPCDNLTSLGGYAFLHNAHLKNIELINTKIDAIQIYTFAGCHDLEKVNTPKETLKRIEGYAFEDNYSFKSLDFPVTATIDLYAFGMEPKTKPVLNISPGTLTQLDVPYGQKISFEANAFSTATSIHCKRAGKVDVTNANDPEDYFSVDITQSPKFYITGGANPKKESTSVEISGDFYFGDPSVVVNANVDIPVSIVGKRATSVYMRNQYQSAVLLDVNNDDVEIADTKVNWTTGKTSSSTPKYVGYVNGSVISDNPDAPTLISLQADIDPSTFTYGLDGEANNLRWEVASGNSLEVYGKPVNTRPKGAYDDTITDDPNAFYTSVQQFRVKGKGEAVLRLVYYHKDFTASGEKIEYECVNLVKINVVNPLLSFDMKIKGAEQASNIEIEQGKSANILVDGNSFAYADETSAQAREPKSLIYTTSNPKVVTVDNNGVIKAQKIYDSNGNLIEGVDYESATITVRTRAGLCVKQIFVTVRDKKENIAPSYFEIIGDDYLNTGGKSKEYSVMNFPEYSNANVDWNIVGGAAELKQNGNKVVLTPVRPGSVTIVATSKINPGVTISKVVNIVDPTKDIRFLLPSSSIEMGQWYSIGFVTGEEVGNGIYRPEGNSDYVTFTVTDSSVAKIAANQNDTELSDKVVINSGAINIKGLKVGKTDIIATTESGGKAKFTIIIVGKTLTAIKVKETASVAKGSSIKLTVTKVPADSTEGVTFSSSDPAIAKVDPYGTVTGVKEGTAVIYVVSDIKKVSAQCTVTVTKAKAAPGKVASGKVVTVKGVKYVGNKDGSVSLKSAPKASGTFSVPATILVNGKSVKVTAIASNALKGNKKIKTLNIGANVKTIGSGAFRGCINLTTVKMGKGVTTIGSNAFMGCKKLKKLTIGANVTKIGNNAFKNCVALAKVTIPAKVTSIGTGAFAGCKNLKSVIIKSKKLKKVGSKAFKTINASAKFKCPAAKLKAYTKLLKKSGVPKNAKITK